MSCDLFDWKREWNWSWNFFRDCELFFGVFSSLSQFLLRALRRERECSYMCYDAFGSWRWFFISIIRSTAAPSDGGICHRVSCADIEGCVTRRKSRPKRRITHGQSKSDVNSSTIQTVHDHQDVEKHRSEISETWSCKIRKTKIVVIVVTFAHFIRKIFNINECLLFLMVSG